MTIRRSINIKKGIAHLIFFGGFIVSGLLMNFYSVGVNILQYPFIFIGFGISFLAMFLAHFVIRCPICKGNLGYIFMTSGAPFSISKKIHYCPYCATNIDDEIE